MSNKKTSSLMKEVNIIFESIEFIILSYLLLSSMYSFRTNVVYILFFAVNVVVIRKFWTWLKRALMSNIAVVVVFTICMTVLTVLFLTCGYLSMSIEPVGIWFHIHHFYPWGLLLVFLQTEFLLFSLNNHFLFYRFACFPYPL